MVLESSGSLAGEKQQVLVARVYAASKLISTKHLFGPPKRDAEIEFARDQFDRISTVGGSLVTGPDQFLL